MLIGLIDGLLPSGAPAREGIAVSAAGTAQVAAIDGNAPGTPSPFQVSNAVGVANAALRQANHATVEFEYDPDVNTTVVRLVEQASGEVLRQIPSPEMLDIARAIERMQLMLVRGRA